MGRIWFLADTHFGVKNDNVVWLNDFSNYFNNVVIPTMRKEYREGDILVHLGDVFDNRSTVGLNTICSTLDIFDKLSEIFDDIRIVVGNHDIYNKSSNDITSLRIFERNPKIKIYFKPEVECICGKNILFNPWVNEIEKENELLSSVNVDYIFGHLDVNGCRLNASSVRSKSENAIEAKNFKKSIVYAGHIHKRQDYKNVHYVGSPYQITRGDRDDIKGLTVLDIKSGETIFFENTYSSKFKDVSIYDILDKTVGEIRQEWCNNFINLIVKGNDILYCKFDDLIALLSDSYRTFTTYTDNSGGIVDNECSTTISNESKSIDEHVDDWLKDNDVNGDIYSRVIDLFKKYKDNYEIGSSK